MEFYLLIRFCYFAPNTSNMKLKELVRQASREITIIGTSGIADELYSLLSKKEELEKLKNIKINILCESKNFLFTRSIFTDNRNIANRTSFTKLKFQQSIIADKLPQKLRKFGFENINIQITYLDIPLRVITIDDKLFSNLWLTELNNDYQEIKSETAFYNNTLKYREAFLNPQIGLKFSSPYRDKKGKVIETIELFDEERIRRGIYPRNSFYDTDFWKVVVWVYIFDRNGRVLIHRRADNAKDNQGMWDKSVGGHMDYEEDIDTYKTVTREVIEELYTDETADINFFKIKDEDMIYLGDWKPEKREDFPVHEINSYSKEWAYFRLPNYVQTVSPRYLQNGKIRTNNVIADVYLFIASKELDEKTLKKFENSSFKLIDPVQLKTAISKTDNGEKVSNFDLDKGQPKFSPDLRYSFKGNLRGIIEEFSQYIKFYLSENG